MESKLAEFEASFVRISKEGGPPTGAGFLMSDDGHVLTCAHVVGEALGVSGDTSEKPQGVVHLDFPFRGGAALTAYVEYWQPLSGPPTKPSGDIAILQLAASPPDGAQPARL